MATFTVETTVAASPSDLVARLDALTASTRLDTAVLVVARPDVLAEGSVLRVTFPAVSGQPVLSTVLTSLDVDDTVEVAVSTSVHDSHGTVAVTPCPSGSTITYRGELTLAQVAAIAGPALAFVRGALEAIGGHGS